MTRYFPSLCYALWLAAAALGCQPANQETANQELAIELGPPRKFPIDSVTNTHRAHLSFFEHQGRSYLLLLNGKDTSFYLYDWATTQLLRRAKLAAEGPQGVGRPVTAVAQSPDSVFLIAPDNRKVSLVNGAGQRLRQYQVEGPANPSGNHLLLGVDTKQPPIKVGPHLYLASSVHLHPSDPQFFA
jgi:hypothetical protein